MLQASVSNIRRGLEKCAANLPVGTLNYNKQLIL